MKKKIIVLLLPFLIVMFFSYRFIIYNPVLESTTQNIDVISKEVSTSTDERWIVLSNGKKVYIDNFSIWALIQENQNYT